MDGAQPAATELRLNPRLGVTLEEETGIIWAGSTVKDTHEENVSRACGWKWGGEVKIRQNETNFGRVS